MTSHTTTGRPATLRCGPGPAAGRSAGIHCTGRWGDGWRRRHADERGASAAIIVLFTVALLTVAGLVIDGGYALGAQREAMNTAEQAARVGSDALSQAALRSGQTRVDPGQAVTVARRYLAQVGASGTVSVDGGAVTVTVTARQDTAILSAVGVGSIPVKATATALSIDEDTP